MSMKVKAFMIALGPHALGHCCFKNLDDMTRNENEQGVIYYSSRLLGDQLPVMQCTESEFSRLQFIDIDTFLGTERPLYPNIIQFLLQMIDLELACKTNSTIRKSTTYGALSDLLRLLFMSQSLREAGDYDYVSYVDWDCKAKPGHTISHLPEVLKQEDVLIPFLMMVNTKQDRMKTQLREVLEITDSGLGELSQEEREGLLSLIGEKRPFTEHCTTGLILSLLASHSFQFLDDTNLVIEHGFTGSYLVEQDAASEAYWQESEYFDAALTTAQENLMKPLMRLSCDGFYQRNPASSIYHAISDSIDNRMAWLAYQFEQKIIYPLEQVLKGHAIQHPSNSITLLSVDKSEQITRETIAYLKYCQVTIIKPDKIQLSEVYIRNVQRALEGTKKGVPHYSRCDETFFALDSRVKTQQSDILSSPVFII